MIKLSDLINAAANQKEWKPLDRKEKERPIVLPTSTSYVNFLDKENQRAVIKKEDDKKEELINQESFFKKLSDFFVEALAKKRAPLKF